MFPFIIVCTPVKEFSFLANILHKFIQSMKLNIQDSSCYLTLIFSEVSKNIQGGGQNGPREGAIFCATLGKNSPVPCYLSLPVPLHNTHHCNLKYIWNRTVHTFWTFMSNGVERTLPHCFGVCAAVRLYPSALTKLTWHDFFESYLPLFQVIDRQERMMGEQRRLIKHLKGKLDTKTRKEKEKEEGRRSEERRDNFTTVEEKALKR